MVRDLRRLADTRFDVLVIGAGIYGAATAWDAAQRGLSVALVDRGDFGGGTSFNNLKTLHGGLRSLQSLDYPQMRRFIHERRALARIVPHLVRALPFVIPTTWHPTRNRLAMRLALAANDLVAADRNQGVADPALHLPDGHLVSRDEALELNPVVSPRGVTGGAVWYDYQMTNADRVTFSFVLSAHAAGAVCANHVGALGFNITNGRVTGARMRDLFSGDEFDVQASVVVNAAGAWAPALAHTLPGGGSSLPAPRLSRAMNVIVGPTVETHACGGLVRGRFLFLVPWRDVSILGTSHDAHEGGPDGLTVSRFDLDTFLKDGRDAFPGARLSMTDVRLVHRGLLPMLSGSRAHVKLLRESVVVDHASYGAQGLISVHGVRYTTARQTAQQAVDTVFHALGHATPPLCRTDHTPLAGGGIESMAGFLRSVVGRESASVPEAALLRLAATYGTVYARVLQVARDQPALSAPIGHATTVTGAEIVYAAREEMAVTVADALIRRTEAGSAGHPGQDSVRRTAELLAGVHGWDPSRVEREIAAVEEFYRLPE